MKTPEEKARDELVARIAKNARALRAKADLTQEQMREYGFNYRYYQKIEAEDVTPNLMTLVKLALAFGVDVKDLLR